MDITDLILDDHRELRRLFSILEQIDPSDKDALSAVWARTHALLDTHAESEERFFYPRLLNVGEGANDSDSAADETKDAIKDHNEIRDAAADVEKYEVASTKWLQAVEKANLANSKHMAEEERQGLTDFRAHASLNERHSLGIRFIAFDAKHVTGVAPVDKDPRKYVNEHKAPDASSRKS